MMKKQGRSISQWRFHAVYLLLTLLLCEPILAVGQVREIVKIASPDDGLDLGLCKGDDAQRDLCQACAALPEMISLPVAQCCGDADARLLCSVCVADPVTCLLDVVSLETALANAAESDSGDGADGDDEAGMVDDGSHDDDDEVEYDKYFPLFPFDDDDDDDDDDDSLENDAAVDADADALLATSKRYGTLYLGKRPLHLYPSTRRTVLADVMKRDDDGDDGAEDSDVVDKRWGTLGLGSNSYGRYSQLFGTPVSRARGGGKGEKRWGTLGIGKRWGSLGIGNGRSWGSLGKKWGTLGVGKRWGSLGIGHWKRWGTLGLGSRYRGKRWGTLGLGNAGRTTTAPGGKRNQPKDVEKRWGSLGLGKGIRWGPSLRGKRWGSLGLSNWRKRWGTLSLGKRDEVLTDLDDGASYLDSLSDDGGDENEKRWGTLGISRPAYAFRYSGPRENKRWGTLSIGKRWGNLGGFGGFKRWGYLGLGGGRNTFLRPRKLAKRSTENKESTGIEDQKENVGGIASTKKDAGVKKRGSLGLSSHTPRASQPSSSQGRE